MAMGVLMTKRNAAMVLVAVMMGVVATASRDLQSERFELIIHSSFEEAAGLGLEKLHACCPSAVTWNCYRVCRLKGNQATCAKYCDCKLGEEITPDCYRLNTASSKCESPTVRKESVLEEAVPNKLHACCQNAQGWNCYRACRVKGSQENCAKLCSCKLVKKRTKDCYPPSMDSGLLMMMAESDGQKLKESDGQELKE